jgi:hypothetical protein
MARIRRFRFAALAVAVLLASGAAVGVAARASAPSLPPVAPERLIASTLQALAADRPVSGLLLAHVDLGLPSLPNEVPQASQGLAALFQAISGDHRVRLWRSPDGFRVSELLPAAEVSLIVSHQRGRAEAWAWDSRSFTAIHLGPTSVGAPPSPAGLLDPLAAARQILAALGPSTRVELGGTARVGGRDAYVLRIEPRTAETLVGRIELSIDSERSIPLRVAVFARGAGSPALSLGFASVGFGAVDPSVYRFSPPAGATVTSFRPPAQGELSSPAGDMGGSRSGVAKLAEYVRTFGTDWTSVVAYRLPSTPVHSASNGTTGPDLRELLPFSGPLFSVRLVDRGDHTWLLVGAVPQSRLAAVEPALP